MTWLTYQIYAYTPLFLFWSSRCPSTTSFPWLRVFQPSWHAAFLCHHTIIPWVSYKMEFSTRHLLLPRVVNLPMKIPMKDIDYPHPTNAPSWWYMMSSFYARWLFFSHKYYLCCQWGYQELLPFYDDYYNNVDFYINYPFKRFQWALILTICF